MQNRGVYEALLGETNGEDILLRAGGAHRESYDLDPSKKNRIFLNDLSVWSRHPNDPYTSPVCVLGGLSAGRWPAVEVCGGVGCGSVVVLIVILVAEGKGGWCGRAQWRT